VILLEKGLGDKELSELTDIPVSTLEKIKPKIIKGEQFKTKHADKLEGWTVKNKLWYKK
jgi:predicted transcriptional regulator